MTSYFEDLQNAIFLYPIFLWGIPGLLFIFAYFVKQKAKLFPLLLKLLALLLLLIAAATPIKTIDESSSHLVAVVDTSASISDFAARSFAEILSQAAPEKGSKLDLITFATTGSALIHATPEKSDLMRYLKKGNGAGATNIESALKAATNSTQASSFLLLTDGIQTTGDALSYASVLASRGIRVYPLVPDIKLFSAERIWISAFHAPLTTYSDQHPLVQLTVRNDTLADKEVLVEVALDKDQFLKEKVLIKAGSEVMLRKEATLNQGGLQRLHATVFDDQEKIAEQHRWISVKERTKMVMISGTSQDSEILQEALQSKGYTVSSLVIGRDQLPESLDTFSLIIFNNVHRQNVSDGWLAKLKSFVEQGGGLILTGGDKSFGLGRYKDSILEEISPVTFVPPQTTKRRLNNAVMLVLDKSRSMSAQGRIDAARNAALSSINSLRDDDLVGVIGFDDAPFPIIRIQEVAKAKAIAPSRLRNLTAAGGTALLKSLSEARKQLERVEAGRKHIIILSDGVIPDASQLIFQELQKLKALGVTVSTVALGSEADVPFMTTLAEQGHGSFYQTRDSSRLPEIFIQDIKVSTGERTVREQRYSVYSGPDGIISTSLNHFPEILGFVQTVIKQRAKSELIVKDREGSFPLLASWNFGMGKVIAYTSDTNGRWSAPWLRWKGFVTFWSDLIESSRAKAGASQDVEFDIRYQIEGEKLQLDLSVFDRKLLDSPPPLISAVATSPTGRKIDVNYSQLKRGRFVAEVEDIEAGDYKIQITYGDSQFPPLAVTVTPEALGEKNGAGVNFELLSELARITGGVFNPNVQNIPRSVRVDSEREYLSSPLFVGAFFLLLISTLLREGVRASRVSSYPKLKRGIDQSLRR